MTSQQLSDSAERAARRGSKPRATQETIDFVYNGGRHVRGRRNNSLGEYEPDFRVKRPAKGREGYRRVRRASGAPPPVRPLKQGSKLFF